MRPLVPEFIQQQYKAGNLAGSFEACALFADISGFTNITDALMGHGQHGAEVLANIIKDVFDPLILSVFEQGRFVTNLAGDAFTAVFPASESSFDVFRRAFAAAWQMQAVMASTAQHQTAYGDFILSVKVGLASGPVNWSIISSEDNHRAVYYFYCGAIDGSASAEKLAGAGDIIVDAAVSNNLGSLDGTWEPLRIMLTCYQVLQLIENPRANEVLVSAYETLFDRADKIPDEDARQVFLENVPWHREIPAIVETNN